MLTGTVEWLDTGRWFPITAPARTELILSEFAKELALQLRILLADDHASIRQMIRNHLEMHPGWEVCGEAADGVEAVQRSAELHPDIVLMDLDMPRLNGLDATRRIHKSSPGVRV